MFYQKAGGALYRIALVAKERQGLVRPVKGTGRSSAMEEGEGEE